MQQVVLIVSFVTLTSFPYIGPVNVLWIPPLFFGLNESRFQQRILGHANLQGDSYETIQSPSSNPGFYDYLRPRIKKHLKHVPNEIAEKKYEKTVTFSFGRQSHKNEGTKNIKTGNTHFLKNKENIVRFKEAKYNDSIYNKIDNATDDIKEEIVLTSVLHYMKKKFVERFSDSQFFKNIFDQFNRTNLLRHSHLNFSENKKRQERKRREVENQAIPVILIVNETEAVAQNSSTTDGKLNCTTHVTSDCLLIWRVDWKSLTLSVVFALMFLFIIYIVLVSCLYVLGLFLLSYFVLLGLFLFGLRRRKNDVSTQTNAVVKPLTA